VEVLPTQHKRLDKKNDSYRPYKETPKPEGSTADQYSNRSCHNSNLEHRYARSQRLVRTKVIFGVLLQLLSFSLNLFLLGIVLRYLGLIGIRRRFP
jgi:hypothetical protein